MTRSASRKRTARRPTLKKENEMSTDSEWYTSMPEKAGLEEVKKEASETKKETDEVKKEVVELKAEIKELKEELRNRIAVKKGE